MSAFQEIVQNIQKGKLAPVYLLEGEETFFTDYIMSHLEANVLDDTQKSFNQHVFYGKDTNLDQIVSIARQFPMMGDRQVVLVKEAQDIADWKTDSKQEQLAAYLASPMPSTILAFAYKYKTMDKRKKVTKKFQEAGVVLTSKKLFDNEVPGWVTGYTKALGANITDGAKALLIENIGNNLQRLANELQKLKDNSKDGKIDDDLVHRLVGISREYNVFELNKAVGSKDLAKAVKIVHYYASNPKENPLVLTLFQLNTYFVKLLLLHAHGAQDKAQIARIAGVSPYFAGEYAQAMRHYPMPKIIRNIGYLHQADLQSKGIGYPTMKEKEVLTELVVKMMQ
jgi:DNA polymerase III subunit delta